MSDPGVTPVLITHDNIIQVQELRGAYSKISSTLYFPLSGLDVIFSGHVIEAHITSLTAAGLSCTFTTFEKDFLFILFFLFNSNWNILYGKASLAFFK